MRSKTKRLRKSNRVSWAPGVNLCQVRFFSSEDCPAKVGLKSQDDLQSMASGALHSDTTGSDDVPPGFERGFAMNRSGLEPSYVPQVQWKSPPKFVPSHTWLVAFGEESEEVKHQKMREMQILEAIYPRVSAIPPSPSVSREVENERYNDVRTSVVPITPIEEEEEPEDTPFSNAAPLNATTISSPPPPSLSRIQLPSEKCSSQLPLGKLPDLGVDVVAATSAALAAITKSNEKGSLIDTDLLIKILRDPKMIERLMNDGLPTATPSASTKNTVSASVLESRTLSPSVPLSSPTLELRKLDVGRTTVETMPYLQDTCQVSRFQQVVTPSVSMSIPDLLVSLPRLSDRSMFSIPDQVRSSVNAVTVQLNTATTSAFAVKEPAPLVKDANYYKNLIRQHGGVKEENKDYFYTQNGKNYFHVEEPKPLQNFKPGEQKIKNSKPCVYFKTSKGCRNGANCPYQHDVSLNWHSGKVMETHRAKRMKLNDEINGRMLVRNY